MGRPAWVERELAGRIRVPHSFQCHTYTRPTVCQQCKKLLKGLFKQGWQCKDCKFNVHKKCMDKVPMDCSGEAPKEWESQDKENPDEESDPESSHSGDVKVSSSTEELEDSSPRGTVTWVTILIFSCRDQVLWVDRWNFFFLPSYSMIYFYPFLFTLSNYSEMDSSSNIPLMRIVQSVKHTKRRGSKVLKEGWMVHFTNKDSTVRTTTLPFLLLIFYPSLRSSCIIIIFSSFISPSLSAILFLSYRPLNQLSSGDTFIRHFLPSPSLISASKLSPFLSILNLPMIHIIGQSYCNAQSLL